MKRIIYQRENGGISIVVPTGEIPLNDVIKKDLPPGVKYQIVDTADIPSDRYFRNAWDLDETGRIVTNIDKAREIHKDRLRVQRKPLLEVLDVEYLQAMETKKDTAEIVAKKQRLRDITKEVDKRNTPEEIRSVVI